jgi:hypothetical protein
MATYRPSFVDISGFTAGLSRGLEMEAQRKRQEDALAEQRVDEFLKTYRPDKLRDSDIGEFTNAYNNYKQAALQYSRMNRSGAKSEQLALANKAMNDALAGLNSVYGNSVKTANKMAEYADAIKIGRAKGLSIPREMLAISGALSSQPISKLNIDNVPSAYAFKLLSEDVDYQKLYKDMDTLGAKATQQVQFLEGTQPAYTFMGQPIKTREKITTETRNPATIVKALPALLADPTHNGLKIQMDNQFQQFANADDATKQEVVNGLKQYFGNINANQVTPEMLIATRLASSGIVKREDDPNYSKIQIDEIKTRIGMSESAKNRAQQLYLKTMNMQPGEYHPSVIIKSIVENIPATVVGKKDNLELLSGVDVSQPFKGFLMKSSMGQNIPIEEVEYVGGKGSVEPYFKVRLSGEEEFKNYQPIALNSLIVTSTPDINYKVGSVPLGNISYQEPNLSSGSFIIKNKTYTFNDLKKLGYTEEQIKQGINLGNIKRK